MVNYLCTMAKSNDSSQDSPKCLTQTFCSLGGWFTLSDYQGTLVKTHYLIFEMWPAFFL